MPNIRLAAINHVDASTITASPSEDANAPVVNVTLTNRDRVFRSSSLATQQIKGTFAASRKANFCSMHRHNLHAGNWRVQLYSDAAWTTQVYDSATIATYTAIPYAGAYEFGLTSTLMDNTDLKFRSADAVNYFGAAYTFQSWKVTLSGSATDGGFSYFEVWRIWLGMFLELTYNPVNGMELGRDSSGSNSRMAGGSLRSLPGENWRKLAMDLDLVTDAQRPVLEDMIEENGTHGDFFVSVFPGAGDRFERDFMFDAKLESLPSRKYAQFGITAMPFNLVEC